MHIPSSDSHFHEKTTHRSSEVEKKEGKKINKTDYFKVFFFPKIGYPPPRSLISNFKEYANFINRPKQTPQNKKIGLIRDKYFKPQKKDEEHTTHHFAHEQINERIHYSESKMNNLREEVKAKFKKLSIHKLKRYPQGSIVELLVYEHWIAIEPFLKLYFAAQLKFADQLIGDGMLLTTLNALDLLKKIINELLPPIESKTD